MGLEVLASIMTVTQPTDVVTLSGPSPVHDVPDTLFDPASWPETLQSVHEHCWRPGIKR